MDFDSKKASITPNGAEYQKVHRWVAKTLGKATSCINGCASTKYTWSNVSRDYLYDVPDWENLCGVCHKKRDTLTKAGAESISRKNKINSLGNQSHAKPILAVFPSGSWIKFSSSRIASDVLGVSHTSISNIISGLASKTRNGLTFRKIGG